MLRGNNTKDKTHTLTHTHTHTHTHDDGNKFKMPASVSNTGTGTKLSKIGLKETERNKVLFSSGKLYKLIQFLSIFLK